MPSLPRWVNLPPRPPQISSLRWEELLALVAEQQRQITKLQGQLAEATTAIETLWVEVDRSSGSKSARRPPFPKVPEGASPSVQAASLARAPSPAARHHGRRKSQNLQ